MSRVVKSPSPKNVAVSVDGHKPPRQTETLSAPDRYALLVETAENLIGSSDPHAIVEHVCRKVMHALGCDVFFNFVTTDVGERLQLNACAGVTNEQTASIETLDYGAAVCGCVARDRQRIVVDEVQESDDVRTAYIKQLGIQAYCCHPLMNGGAVIGTLSFGSRQKRHFTADEIELMRAVANQVALAMQRLRSEQALRQSEREFRALADSMPNLAWWANPDGSITWYNQRWYEYTGTTPEQMAGWGWQSVHDPAMLPQVLERWRAALATADKFEMEFPLRGADGKYRWFLTRIVPVKDTAGRVLRWFGTNTDVSAMREAREALTRSKQQLEQLVQELAEQKAELASTGTQLRIAQARLEQHAAELEIAVAERTAELQDVVKELSTFSYSVSHDLRAPLRTITGFADILLVDHSATLGADAQHHLQRIARAARRMDVLITDVLAYSRMSRAEIRIESIDLELLIRDMLDSQFAAAAKGMVRIVGPFPRVRASRTALEQSITNLISNAIKFVRPGVPPAITIRAEAAGPVVRLCIEDNGIGIESINRDKIWGIFERLNPDYEGTGVGLAIVRRAVDRMGGRVGVDSTPGVGSRFWIELPGA